MKKILIFRFFVVGALAAVVLSVLSTLFMNQISEMGASEHRKNFLLALGSSIETHPLDRDALNFFRGVPDVGRRPLPFGPPMAPPPGLNPGPPPGLNPGPPPGGRGAGGRPRLWVVRGNGEVISRTSDEPLDWDSLPKPRAVHEFAAKEDWLKITPGIFLLKLADPSGSYLVLKEERRHLSGPFFLTQMILLFATVCIAVFLALSLTFYYLQKKSKEAKAVLLRLEKGDLKARFDIKTFDEFGNLLLDFNRMAEQIEKLVGRVQDTEKTRTHLLQELGHDLRTPLTGLNTSFETLKFHWAKITDEQRQELFEIMGGEIEYLGDLLDKLMTISNLDEPHYRADVGELDLNELVSQEVKSRQGTPDARGALRWHFEFVGGSAPATTKDFSGDPHLILRMVRNALDNAAKYATSQVVVRLEDQPAQLILSIEDDGPGFSEKALETFGHRLEHRVRQDRGEKNFSLGLGSVIMKTIASLHGGEVRIQNVKSLSGTGARVEIILPKAISAK